MAIATLWFSGDGARVIDLDAVVFAEWRDPNEDDENETQVEPELEVTFRGDSSTVVTLNHADGNAFMAALRDHAGWPVGSPYRG